MGFRPSLLDLEGHAHSAVSVVSRAGGMQLSLSHIGHVYAEPHDRP